MGPGKHATAAERAHMGRAKASVCMVCLTRRLLHLLPAEWVVVGHEDTGAIYLGLLEFNHCKSGNIRRGHLFGWAACPYHHRGVPQNNMTLAQCRDRWGTALTDGSRLFHDTYGSDDELIALQAEVLRQYHPEESPQCVPT